MYLANVLDLWGVGRYCAVGECDKLNLLEKNFKKLEH